MRLKAINYFCKMLHLRCLTWFWIRFSAIPRFFKTWISSGYLLNKFVVYAFISLVLSYIIVVKNYFSTFYIWTSLFAVKASSMFFWLFWSIPNPMKFPLLIMGNFRNCCFVAVKYKMVDHPGIVDYFSAVSLELLSTCTAQKMKFSIQDFI